MRVIIYSFYQVKDKTLCAVLLKEKNQHRSGASKRSHSDVWCFPCYTTATRVLKNPFHLNLFLSVSSYILCD